MSRRGKLTDDELKIVNAKITDEEAFKKFERDCHLRNLRPSSIKYYKSELASVKVGLAELSINKEVVELSQEDIETLILHLKEKIKVVSINTRLRAIKAFFNYLAHGRERKGVCSVLVAERIQEGDTLPVFIQQNKHFELPESGDKDIIMVGPGTGIALFRSFIQERAVTEATGRSWLFFGDQHTASDFLYQDELEQYQKDRVLTRLVTAFSRDTAQKVYVQHRMLENSKELFEWLKNGAYFYVCGDKQYMAKDVDNTLISIIEKEGVMTLEEAEAYVNEMRKQGRYQRDVY